MGHAKLSPSGAEKYMNCAGSVVLEEGCADTNSEYADEGTAAHALAAMCLEEGKDAAAFIGRRLTVVNGVYWPGQPTPTAPLLNGHPEIIRHFDIDEDMAEHVQTYVDNIGLFVAGVNELFVEVRLPIGHITGEEGAEGTGDVVVLADEGAEVQLHDLKFGRGYAVSPVKNKQLMKYGLGALELCRVLGYTPTRVRLVIHQPRIVNAPSEWVCSVDELLTFADEVKKAATRVEAAVVYFTTHGELHEKYLTPGDAQCKWCKAKPNCPALGKFVQETVGADFQVIVKEPEVVAADIIPALEHDDTLGTKLDACNMIEMFCTAVRAETERRLLRGEAVPSPQGGYKLVQGKRGRRAWVDLVKAEERLKAMRLKREEMYDFKVISPTSAEKLLKGTPKRWDAMQEHITQSAGKAHVAPMSDPRDVLAVTPLTDVFAPIPEISMESLA